MGTRKEYHSGQRVGGRLCFVREVERVSPKVRRAEFLCDCGTTVVVNIAYVVHGNTHSCGCLKSELVGQKNTKHQHAVRGEQTGAYRSWAAMKQRCNDPNSDNYDNYGGRGITVCSRWDNSFEEFYKDMGDRPAYGTIERVDNSRGYEVGNCRWATKQEQTLNTRRNVFVEHDGKRATISQWCSELGITYALVKGRRKAGWSLQDALFKPIDVTKRHK